ncbi:MAG: S8 family serine peptidase [Pseudomonadota bacterium]|nr:S8 family serine peptidase [Pseudomonadota bacterium]
MKTSIRVGALASAISIALLGAGSYAPVQAQTPVLASEEARESYIVRFVNGGVLQRITAAQPQMARAGDRINLRSAAAQLLKLEVNRVQLERIAAISQRLDRQVSPTHHYQVAMNGVALELSAEEAQQISVLAGVESVRKAGVEYLHTYRGPSFIGADQLWDIPGPIPVAGTRGQGIVVASIDGGTNLDHPSFANDPSCGFSVANPKRISAVDCATTDVGGRCNGPAPEDTATGHGVHTSSTAVGNTVTTSAVPAPTLPFGFTSIAGVAPCGSLRSYKACDSSTCAGAAIVASIDNAIEDGVDVINFSISGGTSPWVDNDRLFLDAVGAGIFVAASAGNTRDTNPTPEGDVNHLGPWVMTVAASSHDQNYVVSGLLNTVAPGTPPANTQNIPLAKGGGTLPGTVLNDVPIRQHPTNPLACTSTGGIPASFYAGAVAHVPRGSCTFVEKIQNATAAGAQVVILSNNVAGVLNPATGGESTPTYTILQTEGAALTSFINASAPTEVLVDFNPAQALGDVLANFSLRGPSALTSVTKPDITAPGTAIYAALHDIGLNYGTMGGTSMSSPHVAGAAALVRAIQPTWTPSEVHSALMLTSKVAGLNDLMSAPWTADDVGSGRAQVNEAPFAGFVLRETFANFLAANPSSAGDPKTLNLASARNMACVGSCLWTRTLTNSKAVPTSWTVTVNNVAGLNVVVTPATFSFGGGVGGVNIFANGFETPVTIIDDQLLTITATPGEVIAAPRFVRIDFTEDNNQAPDAHMYVTVQGGL